VSVSACLRVCVLFRCRHSVCMDMHTFVPMSCFGVCSSSRCHQTHNRHITCSDVIVCDGLRQGLPTFNFLGVALVLAGVVCDAVTCNYEETKFFHAHKCSQAEVVYYSSLLGLGFSIITLWGMSQRPLCMRYSPHCFSLHTLPSPSTTSTM
jgi:hypothetical protein